MAYVSDLAMRRAADLYGEAIGTRGSQVRGVVFQTDRGSQTRLEGHRSALLGLWHRTVGGTDRGCGGTTPPLNRFSAPSKKELVDRNNYQSRHRARLSIRYWIEAWYNPHRLHSTIGQQPPNEWEDN